MRTRLLLAWITAPIVAVVVVGLIVVALAALDFREEMTPTQFREGAQHFFVLYLFFAIPLGYVTALLAAAPAYQFLRRRQQLSAPALIVVAAVLAALCLEIVASMFERSLQVAAAVLPVGLLAGALAGVTFWAIALRSPADEHPHN